MANNAGNGGKIALVTGGSRGLGKDSALQLARKGFDLIITYQTKKAYAEEVVKEIEATGRKAIAVQCDVSDEKSVQNAVKEVLAHFGKIER